MKLKEFIHQFIPYDVPICLWLPIPDVMGAEAIFGKKYIKYDVNGKHINTGYELEYNDKVSELPVKGIDLISKDTELKVIDIVIDK